jgi:REP element-mobilizing transposase RayT
MGEMEAEKDMVTRHDLRHDRHTVSLLTDHLVFSPKYSVSWIAKRIKGRSSKLLRDQFPRLNEWCPDHLWAPSSYHKTFQKSFIKNASQSVGHGGEVVEKYISGQKGYERTDTVLGIDEEKEKLRAHKTWYTSLEKLRAHKTWYTSLYNKLFGGTHQK